MKLKPRSRKLALTAHVVSSVGWLGAVLGYIAVTAAGTFDEDPAHARGAFRAMETIGWSVLVPGSLATIATGLILSFGTEWGLLRHRWVLAKFLLTLPATAILLVHLPTVSEAARAALAAPAGPHQRMAFVVHGVGGAVVLLAATILSIFKPWGRTQLWRAR